MDNNNKDFKWTTDRVRTFTHIYSTNFYKVPDEYKYQNYIGKKMDEKICQFIYDTRKIEKMYNKHNNYKKIDLQKILKTE